MSETHARALKIAIDARMYQESGIGRYIRNLLTQLQRLDLENEYFILLTKIDFDNLRFSNNFKKVLADARWYGLSEQIKIPKILYNLKVDLVHFPHFNVPVFFNGKFVVTIHDLIHQHFQMRRATLRDPVTYKIKQLGYKTVFKNALNKSAKILVPSNYVKELLIKEWKVRIDKMVITPEAVDDKIFSAAKNMKKLEIEKVLEKFNIKKPYIFYVGNAHPHKNVKGLIKVFGQLRKKYKNLQLVLAGGDHYFWARLKKEMDSRLRGNDRGVGGIIFTGFVTDKELVALYKGAKCFVMPSFEEGFGIPLLEAMACQCPVISSNAGALKEVGADAALYFDPQSSDDMVEKISLILNNEKLRKELIEKGKKRVKLFSWKKLAQQTIEVYDSIR